MDEQLSAEGEQYTKRERERDRGGKAEKSGRENPMEKSLLL